VFCGRLLAMVNGLGQPYLGGRKPGPPLKDEQQEAHWATISVAEPAKRVNAKLRRAVDKPFDEIEGSQSKRGFVLVRTVGDKRTVCEVQVAGWQGGSQIQIVIPRDRPKEELKEFHKWVQNAVSDIDPK